MLRLLVLACGATLACAQGLDSLCKLAGLTTEEWKTVQSGKVVAKAMGTTNKLEVAVAGVARVRVSRDCFQQQFRDIQNFKRNPAVQQIGKFNAPPLPVDLSALSLEPHDVDALRQCRIGACAIKVPRAVLQQLAGESPRPQQSFSARANSAFRDELIRYTLRYLASGDEQLIVYHDKEKPVRLSGEFHSLLASWVELNALVPELSGHLTGDKEQSLPSSEEFLYWSKENFGLKPVTSITEVTIYPLPGQAWIASKQLYASHYFDASLGITLVADDPADPAQAIYLAYVNRSRIDLLGSPWAGLVRGMVRGRMEEGMRKNMEQTIRKLEAACITTPVPVELAAVRKPVIPSSVALPPTRSGCDPGLR